MLKSQSNLCRRVTPQWLLIGITLALISGLFGAGVQAALAAPDNTATIEVHKVVVPGALPENGTFDLLIDNTIEVSNCNSSGCASTPHPVTGTSATIKEQAAVNPPSSVALSAYNTAIACYDRTVWNNGTPSGPAFASGTGTSLTIDQLGTTGRTDVVCVITNTRKTGQLWVKKEVVDTAVANNPTTFDIQINGVSAPNAPFAHGQFSTRQTVNIGSHTVSEPVDADYNTSIRCVRVINNVITGIHVAGPQAGNSLAVNVDDGDNKDVLCIVTNTRKVGKIEVIKQVVSPAGFTDTGKFDLQIGGITDPDADNIGNGGSTGAQILAANVTYNVGEAVDDPNTDATAYNSALSCYSRTNYNNGQPIGPALVTATSTSANANNNYLLNEGDDLVCLITNTRKTGTIKVVKDVVGDPAQSLGKFNLLIDDANNSNVTTAADQPDNGATATVIVPTGNYNVHETAGTNTSLAKYSSAVACTGNAGAPSNVTATSATVPVAEGENVICTFTNTRLPGNVTVVKDWEPGAGVSGNLAGDAVTVQFDGGDLAGLTGNSADGSVALTGITAGQHTVGEVVGNVNTNLADYATTIVCKDGATTVASGTNAGPLSLFVDSNANIVCTITNKAATINIAKVGNPITGPAFTISAVGPNGLAGSVALSPGQSTGAVATPPGQYIYTETVDPNWVLQDISCIGNSQSTITKDLLAAKLTINLVAGEDVACTFKNVRKSIITLVKDASPADGTDFMFSVNGHSHGPIDDAIPDDNDGHADTLSLANLLPGTYTIDEILPAGWVQTGRSCVATVIGGGAGSSPWNATQSGVQINLAGNEEVRCTFVNEKRGSITINKAADPANGLDFDFTVTPAIQTVSTFKLDDANPNDNDGVNSSMIFSSLAPGAYTFVETLPAGWQAPTLNCTSDTNADNNTPVTNGLVINLDAGENVVCTFDNHIKRGGITVIKEAAPADGTDFSFGGDLGGFVLDDGDADAIAGSKSFTSLLPGNYKITEQVPSDWNLTAVSCVGGNGNDTPITAGVQVTLDPDEQIICTFRNVIKASGITIIKESVPNSPMNFAFTGGTLGNFTLDDAIPDDNDGFTDNQIFTNLLPGTYTIGEPVPLPTGWDILDIVCTGATNSQVTIGTDADFDGGDSAVTINLKPNEQVICTFTNTKRGSVKIVKEADPADGTDFPFSFTGSNLLFNLNESVTLDDDNGSNGTNPDNKTYFDLPPGDYAIAENPAAGWSVTGRTCTGATNSTVSYDADGKTTLIDLAPGENLVCTYENSKQGSITIVKDAFPASSNQFAFSSNLNPALFFLNDQDPDDYHFGDTLNGSSTQQFSALVPGNYQISEIVQGNGWAITHIECTGGVDMQVGSDDDFDLGDNGVTINLAAGENVICEFANQFTVTSGLSLQKTVDPVTYNAVGQQLTYSFVIKNSGNTALTGVQIQEGLPGVTISCPGFNGQLAVNQQVTCTGTYSVKQSDLDQGYIQNSAFAKAENNVTSPPVSAVATAVQTPKLTLIKSVTDNNGGDVVLGDVLTYKLEATNSGNVTMSGVKISDPLPGLGSLSCTPAQPTTLAPGSKLTCTATYTVQTADVNAGLIQNTATVEGFDPSNTKRTAQHTALVTVKRNLSLNLSKALKSNADEDSSGTVSLNDTLTYEFIVTNNSTVAVSNVKVVDPLTGFNGVCGTGTLAVGASTSCTSTYKVKQSDIDNGQIVNVAVASAIDANNTALSAPASATVSLQQRASIDLAKSVSNADEDQSSGVSLNDTLTYQFKVTNDGNVTLNSVSVSDLLPSLSVLSCTPAQPTTLTPGQSMTCTATYKVTSADVTAGKIKNTATATGTDPVTGPVASTDQVSIATQQQLRLGLLKRLAQVTVNQDNSLGIVMEYTLQNQGDSPLTNLALFDNIAGTFANFSPTGFTAANGSLTANQGWNGQGATNILNPFQTLAVGDQGTVYVGFKVTTNQAVQVQTTATANAAGSQGNTVNESASATVDLVGGQAQQPAGATVNGPTAAVSNNNIVVSWTTQAENRISGFRLYRSADGTRANAQALGQTILSHGVATGSGYAFIDTNVQPNTTYTYWLVVIAEGAEIAEHGPASATTPDAAQPTQPTLWMYIPVVLKK